MGMFSLGFVGGVVWWLWLVCGWWVCSDVDVGSGSFWFLVFAGLLWCRVGWLLSFEFGRCGLDWSLLCWWCCRVGIGGYLDTVCGLVTWGWGVLSLV